MSFLYQRFITYLDNATKDPKAEAIQKQVQKLLKSAQKKATKIISDEKLLIKKAQNTPSLGDPNLALKYSIFPDDAQDINTLLDNATKTITDAQDADTVNEYIDETFGDDYKVYKANAITNSSVYPKANGFRSTYYIYIRIIKQLIHDNSNLTNSEKQLLQILQDDIQQILIDTKYEKPSDSATIAQNDLNNLDTYKSILNQSGDKIDKNSQEYKNFADLYPKFISAYQKISKNHFEVDFNDKEGNISTGNINSDAIQAKIAAEEKAQDSFDLQTLIYDTFSKAIQVFVLLMFLFLLSLGSSFAVNLNVHKSLPYKIFYMIYGFIFALIVIPYVLIYRWWFLGKKPIYYGYIPLIPRFFIDSRIQFLLGWLTYRPDKTINSLEEWRNHKAEN